MRESGYSVLNKTINVLVVDDMPEFWSRVKGLLDLFDIYCVHIAENAKAAIEIINKNEGRFHACALDRGMNDVGHDEFYLLDKFKERIPFIIMTARQEPDESFQCGKRGARAFVMKTSRTFDLELVSNINKHALQNVICPGYDETQQNLHCKCIEALMRMKPLSVAEWAQGAGVLERQLQREWKEHFRVNPLHSLYVFHLYLRLFTKIENYLQEIRPQERFSLLGCVETLLRSSDYNRIFEYCLLNWSQIHSYISAAA
jgi:DNA-binding NarL/FixJ family response regulator